MTDTTTLAAPTEELLSELEEVNQRLANAPASHAVRWAVERFGSSLSLACSFQDVVLVDLAHQVQPDIEVVFLDTGAHFQETWDFVATTKARYNLNLVTLSADPADAPPACGTDGCCAARKVAPLRTHLVQRDAWLTSLKRVDAPTRADIEVVAWDPTFGVVKINPLATWSDDDVDFYIRQHGLDEHPLISRGYLSIGCAPTTKPVAPGADPRSGRWADSDKTECGLHA